MPATAPYYYDKALDKTYRRQDDGSYVEILNAPYDLEVYRSRENAGSLVPFSFSGADVFDDTDTMDVFIYIPARMYEIIEVRAQINFREFFTSAKSATSGGGSTSGSSSASSSDNSTLSLGMGATDIFGSSGAESAGTAHTHSVGSYALGEGSFVTDIDPHHHGISHTHSTPAHAHSLTYGVYKEAYPASHSVTLTVYELVAGTWTSRHAYTGLTADLIDQDLTTYILNAGNWRLTLKSAAAQPNGGRLGCDVSGYVLGSIITA